MSISKKKNNDNKILSLSLVFIFIFMIILVPLFNKGTQSTDVVEENTDYLTLTCLESVLSGEEVECSVSLNSTSMVTQGITIKYGLPDGVSFVEFTTDTFEIYSSDEYGVVLVNEDGISGEVLVGKLKLKMPADADANSVYKIELVEATIGDGDETVVNLDSVSDEIRIKSDINTLDNITISDGNLNETFDKDTLEYTVTTDLDKITISAVATDKDRATISGDIDTEKTLHYGTNEFSIVVTSESGIEKTYRVSIFRTYVFSTDKYIYNEEGNYIYVGTDIDNLEDNISVDSKLTKKVDDDKLVISYLDEIVLEIDILNISFDKYSLDNNILYVDKELTVDEFSANVEYSDGIEFEFTDDNKVMVLYDNEELASYQMVVYSLNFVSILTIDEENLYIKHVILGTTVEEFLGMVTIAGGDIHIYNKSGVEKVPSDLIATGDVFKVYLGESIMDEYVLSVLGDSSGDGKLSTIDLAQFRKHLVDWVNPNTGIEFELSGVYSEAFDLNKDGKISVLDLAIMRKKIVGLI